MVKNLPANQIKQADLASTDLLSVLKDGEDGLDQKSNLDPKVKSKGSNFDPKGQRSLIGQAHTPVVMRNYLLLP